MIKHIYPSWHKPAQRCLFLLGAILLITLPAMYGTTDAISSETLALTLALYFGFWLAFSLIVRFAIPSAQVESTLPTYTHAPVPAPILHTPNKHAVPAAPAIRIHTTGSEPTLLLLPNHDDPHHQRPRKTARFASPSQDNNQGEEAQDRLSDATEDREQDEDNNNNDDVKGSNKTNDANGHPTPAVGSINHPKLPTTKRPNNLNVTFEHHGRPHSPRMDSSTSDTYPTYAAYRQAQHGNFDAFAQRIKRAFQAAATVRTTPEPSPSPSLLSSTMSDHHLKDLQPSTLSALDDQLHPSTTPSTTGGGPGTTPLSGRSRSTSAASVLGDIADKIKAGTLMFGRSITRSSSQQSGFQAHHASPDYNKGNSNDGSSNSSGGGATAKPVAATTTIPATKPRSRAVSDAGMVLTAAGARQQSSTITTTTTTPTRPSLLLRSHSTQPAPATTSARWDHTLEDPAPIETNTATTTAFLAPHFLAHNHSASANMHATIDSG